VNTHIKCNSVKAVGKSENVSRRKINEKKRRKGMQQEMLYSIQNIMSVNFF